MTPPPRRSVPANVTVVEMTQIVLPSHANNHGTAFGGQMAAWIDICAAVSAQRFSRTTVVTASMDELHFLRGARRGMIVVLKSQVNQAWNSSIEVGVRVETEDPLTGDRDHCCSAYLTFVALDQTGKKVAVPKLDTEQNPVTEQRAIDAQKRRDTRLSMRAHRRTNPTTPA